MPGIWKPDEEAMFVSRLSRLGEMFGREVTKSLLSIYRENLDDMDGDLVVVGLMACEQESRFWPSVAEIRERSGASNVALMQQRVETRAERRKALGLGPDNKRLK